MENIRVSVAMATYNGEKYIKEQIDSILENLKENDEIVISDDGSTDDTLNIIKHYNDSRIKIINGPKKGVKKNFENAIKNTKGKYIFLSDQDDIWEKNKIDSVLKAFDEKDISLVVHDAKVFDSDTKEILYESFFSFRNSGNGILKNWIKNTYIGCCIAFKSTIKEKILPIPNNIEMHDQWIGIVNELKAGKSLFIEEKLLRYRRHSDNVSQMKHYPIIKMIFNRLVFLKEIVKRFI